MDTALPDTGSPRARRAWRFEVAAVAAAAVAAALALSLANVFLGPLNQDEGWYLLAAQNVGRGMMPYRDFFYTQGPVHPLFYAAFARFWAPSGVLGGRLFTALLGLFAAFQFSLCAACLAGARRGAAGLPAAFLAFVLLALSPDWAYFAAIPKTYALGSLLLGLGFVSVMPPPAPGAVCGRSLRSFGFAGVCFALAAATRATLCLAAVPVWIALLRLRREPGYRLAWFRFAFGCAAALFFVYGPVFAFAGDNFLFSQTFHAARAAAPFKEWLVLRAGFVCFLAQGYPALVAAAAVLAAVRSFGPSVRRSIGPEDRPEDRTTEGPKDPLYWSVVAAFVLLTAVHFLVPFPYADYNVPAMPLAAVALAVPLGGFVARAGLRPWRLGLAVLAASVLFVAGSPWPMKWVGGRQDRFWFKTDSESALAKLRLAGRLVRELNPDGKPILTQDAYVAVEAGCPVVAGLEAGPFSVFPDLSDEEARKRRVHNVATLEEAIRACDAPVATTSGYTFAIACPSTEPMRPEDSKRLNDAFSWRYRSVVPFPAFGQERTLMNVFFDRIPPGEPSGPPDGWQPDSPTDRP